MKKILILVALLLAPSVALAKQGSRNLDAETKLDKTCFVFPDFALTDNDPGSTGVLVAQALNSGPASYNITTVHAMPYAARVGVVINDANANDTALTCATVFVTGLTTDGTVKTEALGTIPETTPVYTTNVFLRVDRIRTGTCGDGTDATDFLLAFTSQYAWVGKKIRSDADVVSACSVTAANIMNCGTAATIATAVNPSNSTIDLLSATLFDGAAGGDEEVICITTLPGF
jgi:hypothetical protein